MCLKNLNVLLPSAVSVKGCLAKPGLMVTHIYKKLVKMKVESEVLKAKTISSIPWVPPYGSHFV